MTQQEDLWTCTLCGVELTRRQVGSHFMAVHPGRRAVDNGYVPLSRAESNRRSNARVGRRKQQQRAQNSNQTSVDNSSTPSALPTSPPASRGATNSRSIEEAALLSIVPRRFEISSTLVWQAKFVTEKEWGWKHTEDVGTWLDTFIWWAMQKFGIILQGYVVMAKPPVPTPKPQIKAAINSS